MLDRVRELRVPVRTRGPRKWNYSVLGWLCSRQDLIGPKECNCHVRTRTAPAICLFFRGPQTRNRNSTAATNSPTNSKSTKGTQSWTFESPYSSRSHRNDTNINWRALQELSFQARIQSITPGISIIVKWNEGLIQCTLSSSDTSSFLLATSLTTESSTCAYVSAITLASWPSHTWTISPKSSLWVTATKLTDQVFAPTPLLGSVGWFGSLGCLLVCCLFNMAIGELRADFILFPC